MDSKENKIKRKGEANLLYTKANFMFRAGRIEEALKLLNQAIEIYQSAEYYNNRAACYKRLGNFQKALDDYENLINNFPKYAKTYLSIGSTYIELGRYEESIKAYEKFYTLYQQGFFTFNPIWGGASQSVQGEDEIETIFLTSINYLLTDQKILAKKAFEKATNNKICSQKIQEILVENSLKLSQNDYDDLKITKDNFSKTGLLPDLGAFLIKNFCKIIIQVHLKPAYIVVQIYPKLFCVCINFATYIDSCPFVGNIWIPDYTWERKYKNVFESNQDLNLLIKLWVKKEYRGLDGVQVIPFKVIQNDSADVLLDVNPELTESLLFTLFRGINT